MNFRKIIEKCKKQKTISTHLVLSELEKLQNEIEFLRQEHRDLQHYSNKHSQIMKNEIGQLKAKLRKVREKVG